MEAVPKPTMRDVSILLGLQVGIAALAAGILSLLPFDTGSGSWVAGLGVMIGAQSFVVVRAKNDPGAFTPAYAHRMAMAVAAGQVLVGGALAGVMVALDGAAMEALPVSPVAFVAIVAAIAGPLAYALTRWGFRTGLSTLTRAAKKAQRG